MREAIVLGVLLVVVDAFVFNQGAIALLVGLGLLLVGLPRTFLAKQYRAVRIPRLRNMAVYFLAVILVFALNAANNHIARTRAETLISAVKAFHAKNQRYPKSLEELVPEHIGGVPLAKFTFFLNRFWYHTTAQSTQLYYVAFPPFDRPTYFFESNEWALID